MAEGKAPPAPLLIPPLRIWANGIFYEMLRTETKIRRDGYLTALIWWRGGGCEECGEPFEFRTTHHVNGLTRHCDAHRKRKRAVDVQPEDHPAP